MPKIKLNKLIDGFTGKIGNLELYEADGQILARKAREVNPNRSEKQEGNSSHFKQAGVYAAAATADPAVKAAYEAQCHGHQNARNVAIRDALTPPVIEVLNLDAYTGQPGQLLRVKASDDFRVSEVHVAIHDTAVTLIEEGSAQWHPETAEWCYAARVQVPAGQTVAVTATAKDNPGNITQCQRWHFLG